MVRVKLRRDIPTFAQQAPPPVVAEPDCETVAETITNESVEQTNSPEEGSTCGVTVETVPAEECSEVEPNEVIITNPKVLDPQQEKFTWRDELMLEEPELDRIFGPGCRLATQAEMDTLIDGTPNVWVSLDGGNDQSKQLTM